MERASEMDSMRLAGKTLGPLHGIPILLKVCYNDLQIQDTYYELNVLGQHRYT